MKTWLKANKFIAILLAVILGFAFYWYEWRPTRIRKECSLGTFSRPSVPEEVYKNCLRKSGLEK